MKKSVLTILLVLSFFLFAACEKTESTKTNEQQQIKKTNQKAEQQNQDLAKAKAEAEKAKAEAAKAKAEAEKAKAEAEKVKLEAEKIKAEAKKLTVAAEKEAATEAKKPTELDKKTVAEIAIQINCTNRSKMPKQEKKSFRKDILDLYSLTEKDYHELRVKYLKDMEFKKMLFQGLKQCPRTMLNTKKVIKKHVLKRKKHSYIIARPGKYVGSALFGALNGPVNLSVQGHKVQYIKFKFQGKLFNIMNVKLAGKNIIGSQKLGADSATFVGKTYPTFVKGKVTCKLNGKQYVGKWIVKKQ